MVKPDKEADKKRHPAHVQDFHLAGEIKYIELFSRHNFYSIVFKLLPPASLYARRVV